MKGWKSVSPKNTCPICDGPDNCTQSTDGRFVYCGRVSDGSTRQNNGGQYLHIIRDRDNQSDQWTHPSHLKSVPKPDAKSSKPVDLPKILKQCAGSNVDARRQELAEQLGVSAESLSDLAVGYGYVHGYCWTFPERNAIGQAIGINRRFRNGTKKSLGPRGLTYADNWDRGGAVLLVEGGSDVASLMTMGLSAIGRPSNVGGVNHLAEMLINIPHDRLIVVVGEDDRLKDGKPRITTPDHKADCQGCGQCWPGMIGAVSTATRLAEQLGRPIAYALPGSGAKDAREWLRSNGNDGSAFLSQLRENITVIDDESPWESLPVTTVEPRSKPVVPIEQVRDELLRIRLESLGAKVIFLDRSGMGSGKTHATVSMIIEAANRGMKVGVLVPTHENAEEMLDMIEQQGKGLINAGKYPGRITPEKAEKINKALEAKSRAEKIPFEPVEPNCWNREAEQAQALTLSVASAVCPGCPLRMICESSGFLNAMNEAKSLQVRVATHARGSFQTLDSLFGDCDLVVIDEDPTDVLRPTAVANILRVDAAVEALFDVLTDPAL